MTWQIITGEYPPVVGGISGYSQVVAEGLAAAGDEVHVWCPPLSYLPASNGVTVHPALGRISRRDLSAVDRLLDHFPPPRRMLVQWLPHGFGYRSMNVGFCTWLLRRARRGDRIEIMVHEPYLGFGEGGIRWTAAACVHRVMTIILARAASRVWMAIPQWEPLWRPYALGRNVPFAWLPIPSSLPVPAPEEVRRVRDRYAPAGEPIVGHLSSYGMVATRVLVVTVPAILQRTPNAVVVLLGQHGDYLRRRIVSNHPHFQSRLFATGTLSSQALAQHVGACDVLVQPYEDGVSTRRTSAMAALALGVAIVTTDGHLTEGLWAAEGAVSLVRAGDSEALASEVLRLLSNDRDRRAIAARGRDLYLRQFDLCHTVGALRRAADEPCASPS